MQFLKGFLWIGLIIHFCVFMTFASFGSQGKKNAKEDPKTVEVRDHKGGQQLYGKHCATCHGEDRFGRMGPALIPETLRRVKPAEAKDLITNGRPLTQMPGFKAALSIEDIAALSDYIYSPVSGNPDWTLKDIEQSHKVLGQPGKQGDKPQHTAALPNMFVVVEAGDHHVTILDGDRMHPLARIKTPFALHGGPKFSQDGRFVFMVSRDGWVSRLDMFQLKMTAEIRAGLNSRNLALSADGRFVMVANYLPATLTVLDAETLRPIKVIEVKNAKGVNSRVSAVYTVPNRSSFVAALKDFPEIWEVSYSDSPDSSFYKGVVHDYSKESGEPIKVDRFAIRAMDLPMILDDFFFDPDFYNIIGASRDGGKAGVFSLIAGRSIATIDVPGLPHLGSGISWERDGKVLMASPNLSEGVISIIELGTWKVLKRIETAGPGFFIRSHENSKYAWADAFMSKKKDTIYIIDKQKLEVVKELTPIPGKTAAHIEFTKDGRFALLSIWEDDGMLIVYDAEKLTEVKRLPMKKPVGKYNVFNKTHYSSGTSR